MRIFSQALDSVLVYKAAPVFGIRFIISDNDFAIAMPIDETSIKGGEIIMARYQSQVKAQQQLNRLLKFFAADTHGDFFFERDTRKEDSA